MDKAYSLIIKKGDEIIKVYSIKKNEVIIGRNPESDLVLDDPLVSRKHCKILIKENSIFIKDLNSTNGTFLNGKRISFSEIKVGDEISIGIYNLIVSSKDISIDESTRQIFDIEKRLSFLLKEEKEKILRLKEMDLRDELTGIYTRRAYKEKIKKFLERADKTYIFFIDIDNFKKFNDTYGHSAGDLLLVFLAGILRKLEDIGFVFRWGGEEFVIFLPDFKGEEIVKIAKELLKDIEEKSEKEIGKKVTVSIGISLCESYEDIDKKIEEADFAMYRAKEKGKNKVEYAESFKLKS